MEPKESFQDFIEKEYKTACDAHSDIHEHLPVLRALAESVNSVTEFGVHTGVSTRAFLAAGARLRSYDIELAPDVQELFSRAQAAGKDARCQQGDTLRIDIEPTDLLFIDTLHTYAQCSAELSRHARRVNRYIVFHDTITFGLHDSKPGKPAGHKRKWRGVPVEWLYRLLCHSVPAIPRMVDHWFLWREQYRQNTASRESGVLNAVLRHLADHPDEWRLRAHYVNNNGLTVLERIADAADSA